MFLHTKTIALPSPFLRRRRSDLSCLLIRRWSPRSMAFASPSLPLLFCSRLHPPWICGTALMLPMRAWRNSSSVVFSAGGPMWRSGSCSAMRMRRRRLTATSSPSRPSTSVDSWFLPTRFSGSAAPLLDRAAALEPQRDPAHRGLHRDVRGVPGDRAPLRVVEIFLLYLLDQGERPGDPSADGMHGHPPPRAMGGRVHALPALQIQ